MPLITFIFYSSCFDFASRIYVADRGNVLVEPIVKQFQKDGFANILSEDCGFDILNKKEVEVFFEEKQPECVIFSLIHLVEHNFDFGKPLFFIERTLLAAINLLHAAVKYKTKKVLFLISSEIFSFNKKKENRFLDINDLKSNYIFSNLMCCRLIQAFREQYNLNCALAVVTCDVYGDKRDHMYGGLFFDIIRNICDAHLSGKKSVTLRCDPKTERHFLYIDDVARAAVALTRYYESSNMVYVGATRSVPVEHLCNLAVQHLKYKGKVSYHPLFKGDKSQYLDLFPIHNYIGWSDLCSVEKMVPLVIDSYIKSKKA